MEIPSFLKKKVTNDSPEKIPTTTGQNGQEQSPAMSEALQKLEGELNILKTIDSDAAITAVASNPEKEGIVSDIMNTIAGMANTVIDIAGQLKENPKVAALLSGVTSFVAIGTRLVTNPEGWKLALTETVITGSLLLSGVLFGYGTVKEAK